MESFVVSALKYRPATFRSVVGQDSLTTTLKNAIKSNKLAHAYLFCGPRGVGKTTCARIFAKTINCEHLTEDNEACNQCESCKSFNEQRSYNIHELDAASNNGVDDIRSLTDQVRVPPQIGRYSVYIIDEVHMLSQGAFNAFLKTLEEPPAHAIFILATTEKHKIIPTILSRCQIYDFNRISITDTVNHLKYVAGEEHVMIEDSALNIIAQKSDGGMRDALSIFDQLVSFSGNHITYQNVIENLNVLDYEYYFRLTHSVLEGKVSDSLLIFDEVLNKGFDAQHFITGFSSHLRDVLVCKDPITIQLLEVGAEIAQRYKLQAADCPAEFIFSALKISNDCDLNYRISKNKRLLVELALIRICQLADNKKKILTETDKNPLQKTVQASETNQLSGKTPAASAPTVSTSASEVKPEAQPKKTEPEIRTTENKEKQEAHETKPTAPVSTDVRFQRPVSISISSLRSESQDTSSLLAEPAVDEKKSKSFTNDDLEAKWKAYIALHDEDPGTKAFLEKHYPELTDENTIKVLVDNKFQEKELMQMNLMTFLRKELNNDSIKLHIELAPENDFKKHQSPQEIYKRMAKDYPNLERLRKNLDMEID
ncbi:MAG: DNA polymerase III subunit gamma/tau [Paludibacteraceae bacterium]|nr:DNA polymerase III subunit gamma/tau [Paludibacteraceae bacterium]